MRIFVGKAYVGVASRGRSLDNGCREEISRNKTDPRTKILQTLIVQHHCCENFVEFGCQGIVQ
jgi:hypothetical protein